ncbi:cysteinyl-tRNA synthetase [Paenibacillus forsythiae]|uniref:Cysteinyl-tRNA synthetase n=2 Tax=Paenibacillus forsythiae TaxID=365616 RepID=A0ABU3HAD6_9BACL|nr:hypothetical protein [Paenibacillus forsythiae]MDT3427774.1 cysteinyl-tRNA synthetase [Paenibacillus forsythiae]
MRIYNCGPTLNDSIHFGCYRIFLMTDFIVKHFRKQGVHVEHGMNIMDIDDHIIEAKTRNPEFSTESLLEEMKKEYAYLSIDYPEKITCTSTHYHEMYPIINQLLASGLAYTGDKGIYLNINRVPDYGKISNLIPERTIAKDQAKDLSKINHYDPSLWKFEENGCFELDYYGRKGRPGWDIQCVSSIINQLKNPVDYHVAGFNERTHYENEEAIYGAYTQFNNSLAKKWVLVKYVLFTEESPYFYMRDYINAGYTKQEIRFIMFNSKFDKEFKLNADYIKACRKNLKQLNEFYSGLSRLKGTAEEQSEMSAQISAIITEAKRKLDEINIPFALAQLFKLIRMIHKDAQSIPSESLREVKSFMEYLDERLLFLYH